MAYEGLFLRHFMGDEPGRSGGGQAMSNSPDIILEGTKPVEPSSLATAESYSKEPPNSLIVGSEQTNYIYVRALNAATEESKARIWLWYAEPSMLLWPQHWISDGFWVENQKRNYYDIAASSPNQIVVSNAFQLVSPKSPQDHYCMVAIAQSPAEEQPPNPGYMVSMEEFAKWVSENPNAAWRNTVDMAQNAATWNWSVPIAGPDKAAQLMLGVQCSSMPVGSKYEFKVAGGSTPSGEKFPTLESGPRVVQNPNENVALPTKWPGKVQTTLNITWYQNNQPNPPIGATIAPSIGIESMMMEGLLEDPLEGAVQTLFYEGGSFHHREKAQLKYYHVLGGVPLRCAPPSSPSLARQDQEVEA
ncbi:MAG TPA: hypothetical protein VGV69_01570 [Solirubrobacterales bacterium]|nr:hypothetical protein [Solirubrobacterales bacterium]